VCRQRKGVRIAYIHGVPDGNSAWDVTGTHVTQATDAIERVTIGRKEIQIRLSDAVAVKSQDRTLAIPWARPSPYQRREIVQSEGQPRSPIRPMRVQARAVFAESLRNAHCWLDELIMDPNQTIELIAARENKSARSIRMTLSLSLSLPRSSPLASKAVCPAGSVSSG
jgi:hypothetical protein